MKKDIYVSFRPSDKIRLYSHHVRIWSQNWNWQQWILICLWSSRNLLFQWRCFRFYHSCIFIFFTCLLAFKQHAKDTPFHSISIVHTYILKHQESHNGLKCQWFICKSVYCICWKKYFIQCHEGVEPVWPLTICEFQTLSRLMMLKSHTYSNQDLNLIHLLR